MSKFNPYKVPVHFYEPSIDELTTKCGEFVHPPGQSFVKHSKYKNRVTCKECLKQIKTKGTK